ncbi:MAG: matrixin family metalloprotease [Chthonomonas sp.]|nr:matrixin family metalloprotease [Chthonomonas sp.]
MKLTHVMTLACLTVAATTLYTAKSLDHSHKVDTKSAEFQANVAKYKALIGKTNVPAMLNQQRLATPAERKLMLPLMTCFAPGTDPAIVSAFQTAMESYEGEGSWSGSSEGNGLDYRLNTRWSGTSGTPRALTWSLVPDGTTIDGGTSNLFAKFDAAYASQGGRATWVGRFAACFARWQQLTGLSYTQVKYLGNDWDDGAVHPTSAGAAGLRGDLRIGGRSYDGLGSVLAYNFFPSTGDMVIDTDDMSYYGGTTNFNRFIRDVVMHEHGHGSGLNHLDSSDSKQLMEPYIDTTFDGPQHDDIRANQRHYGDKYESNNTSGTATNLGAMSTPSTQTIGDVPADGTFPTMPIPANSAITAISANGDEDWYKITLAANTTLTATLNPIGFTYQEGAQGGAQAALNSLAIAQLVVTIYDTNGTTVLGTNTAGAAGLAASTSAVALPAGTYYVRASENGSPTATQMYKLVMSTISQKAVSMTIGLAPWPVSRNSEVSLTAKLRNVGSTTALTTFTLTDPDENGVFTAVIPGTYNGAYNVWVNGTQWNSKATNCTVAASGVSNLGSITMDAGDSLDDNIINTDDYLALSYAFDTTPADSGWNAACDYDGNDIINTDDYLTLSGNFDLAGDN